MIVLALSKGRAFTKMGREKTKKQHRGRKE